MDNAALYFELPIRLFLGPEFFFEVLREIGEVLAALKADHVIGAKSLCQLAVFRNGTEHFWCGKGNMQEETTFSLPPVFPQDVA